MSDDCKRKLIDMDDVDEKTIEKKPWAQRLLTHSLQLTKKAVLNWCNIVSKIGESELDVDDYVSIFLQQIEGLYEDLIMDVEAIQEKSLDKIMKLLQQMQNLCKDLHVEIPTFNYEEVPLSELRKVLVKRVEEYESLAEIRRKELQHLQHKQIELCKRLGREPKLLPESPLPRSEEVENLRTRIESLENEAMEREETFFQLKEQIMDIIREFNIPPTLDFEREILTMENTEVKISDCDMEQLHLYHNKIVKQSKSIKEEIAQLRVVVDDLWDKLETDIAERDSFRQKNIGNSVQTLKALKMEVSRLEEVKKANIKVFINKQRQELEDLWRRCHCTENDKKAFTFYHSECYNEDLFELHERELEKWKAYYEENKELFKLLEEHKTLWNDLKALELNSGGANRFKNRGGQLLIEEKLRNKLTKRIPKVEANLISLAEAYFHRKGKQFSMCGQTMSEYIEKLHEERDKEFKLKLSAKKQQREQQTSTVGRSRMNLFPLTGTSMNPTLTPRSCKKRKVITTPATEPLKKLKKVLNNSKSGAKTGMPKLNVSRNRRRSGRRRRQRLSFKSSTSSNKENNNTTASTSYQDFVKEVSTRNDCRSTGFVLQEKNELATPSKAVPLIAVNDVLLKTQRPLKKAL